ncbi:MAG TPA: ARMT1-like domain-containing protein [Candidatus Deferrimicrobiaceae bacterium]|jgi:hypothetical protein
MITLASECYPCFFRQADLAARAHGAPETLRLALAGRIASMLHALPAGRPPAALASDLQATIRETLGADDPFHALKRRELARFGETSRRALDFVSASPDPLAAAVGLAALANIMDSGIIDDAQKDREIARIEEMAAAFVLPESFRTQVGRARTVGVLLDNAGEAAFDVPLLAWLNRAGKRVWIAAKGGPVIDDLTIDEAREIGLQQYGELFSNGNRAIGTDLAQCPPEFRERLHAADLVLSKGQGNFETLSGKLSNGWFLLRCKCPVISRAVGRPEGELLLIESASAQA